MFNLVTKLLLNKHTQNQQSKPRILRYMLSTFYIYFRENFKLGKQTELSDGPQTNRRLDLYNVPEPRDCLGMFNLVTKPLLNNHTQNKQSKPRILRYKWSTFYIYFRESFTLGKQTELSYGSQNNVRLDLYNAQEPKYCLGMFNLVTKLLLNNHTRNQQSKPRILRYMWSTFYIYFRENFKLGKQTELSDGPQTNRRLDLYNVPEPRDCLGKRGLVTKPLLNNHTENKQSKPRILRYKWSTFYIYFREKFTLGKQTELSYGSKNNVRLDLYNAPEPKYCLGMFNLVPKLLLNNHTQNQ